MTDTYSTSAGQKETYERRGILGKGGTATVYFVVEKNTGRPYAVKAVVSGISMEELKREADIQRRCQGPYVPAVKDVVLLQEVPCMVMEYKDGKTLEHYLKENGPLSEKQMLRLGIALCGIFEKMHRNRILYLDLKPANIMLKSGRLQVLLDFGCAREFAEESVLFSDGCGTRAYGAPEQFQAGQSLNGQADIYALGKVLFEAAGQPWEQKLSSGTAAVLEQCIQTHPRDRPSSSAKLKRKFRTCLAAVLFREYKRKFLCLLLMGLLILAFSVPLRQYWDMKKLNYAETLLEQGETCWYQSETEEDKREGSCLCREALEYGLSEEIYQEASLLAGLYPCDTEEEANVSLNKLYQLYQLVQGTDGGLAKALKVQEEFLLIIYRHPEIDTVSWKGQLKEMKQNLKNIYPSLEGVNAQKAKELLDTMEEFMKIERIETFE